MQSLDDYDEADEDEQFRGPSQKEIARQSPCQWPVVYPVLLLQVQYFTHDELTSAQSDEFLH